MIQSQIPNKEAAKHAISIPMQVLGSTNIERSVNTVSLSTKLEGDPSELLAMAMPAVLDVRAKARDVESMNNIRQLALAMLNFESAYQRFPSAVLVSPAGKKYSWRIAILPFVGHNDIYDAYRMDEEWNSEHNAKVTASVPPVFRHPNSKSKTNTSYFAVVGNETMFPPGGNGMSFGQVTDGSPNTILLVEAKKDIHWAEPRDLAFDPGMQRELGGYSDGEFVAVLTDGSCHRLSNNLGNRIFKAMVTRAGGEIFDSSDFQLAK